MFDEKYDNRTGNAGERIELKCNVKSNPPADLTWFREQEPDKVGIYSMFYRFSKKKKKFQPTNNLRLLATVKP